MRRVGYLQAALRREPLEFGKRHSALLIRQRRFGTSSLHSSAISDIETLKRA